MELFYDMMHFLTSWCTFWRNDEIHDVMVSFDVMTNALLSWRIINAMKFFIISGTKYMKTCFWYHHDVFWHHDKYFDIMTYFWLHGKHLAYFWRDVLLTSWRTFWSNVIMTCFDTMTKVLTSRWTVWRIFGVMTYFWCHSVCSTFDVMEVLMTWHTFLRHEAPFTCFTNCLTSWRVFEFITNCLVS